MINISDLEAKWAGLQHPSQPTLLNGIRIGGLPIETASYVAIDGQRHRHLLVRVDPNTEPMVQRPTRALEVRVHDLAIGDSPQARYLDLSALDSSADKMFASITAEIARELAESKDPTADALRILKRWRWFWSVDPDRLGRDGALGLFGELWFLFRWLDPLDGAKLQRWVGPEGFRHDFQWAECSVEVKTAAGAPLGGVVHRIASLDQLDDPVKGKLYMFSLHVTDDALATNSLPRIVRWISDALRDNDEAQTVFEQKLAKVGYSPALAQLYDRPLRVMTEELYEVRDGFPRLTRARFPAGLPAGVDNVTYTISMAASSRWKIASAPVDAPKSFH